MRYNCQPPSGGCVLKQDNRDDFVHASYPAAFGRLCVETCGNDTPARFVDIQPPSGGCVLKLS